MGLTSHERASFAHTANRYVDGHYDRGRRRALIESASGFGEDAWAAYAGLGWLGLTQSAAHGGFGGGAADLAALMEIVGSGLLMEPVLATVVLGAPLVEIAGSSLQRDSILPAVADGRLILAFAHSEHSGGRGLVGVRTTARQVGDDRYYISGEKTQVLHGSCAEQWVVSARLVEPPGALSLFLVDRDAQGVTLTVDRDIADRPLAKVRFEGVMIPATQRLGTSDAAPLIDAVLDRAALAACSESLGALNAAFRATVRYVNGRKQFGRTLGSFQVLRHRLVDMRIAEIEARAVIGAATEAVDQGTPNQREMISSAKVITDRAAKFVCENSIQLHGGMGMTDDLDVGHYYKRVLSIASQFGDVDWHLDRIAARIGRDDDPRVTPPGHEECPR